MVLDLSHDIGLVSGEPLGLSDYARVHQRLYMERAPQSGHGTRQGNKDVDVCLPE